MPPTPYRIDADRKKATVRPVKAYSPSEEDKEAIAEVDSKFDSWRTDRRPLEQEWFINAAFATGNQNVEWDSFKEALTPFLQLPSHRVRLVVNRIFPKVRSRLAKFVKNRPIPVVVPASTDREDRMNARATQKVLDYLWRKLLCEEKYRDAIIWGGYAGKGFWAIRWDKTKTARIKLDAPTDPMTGQALGKPQIVPAPLGDVEIDGVSPFEILVPSLTKGRLREQEEMMRASMHDVESAKRQWEEIADYISGDTATPDIFHFERQIGLLTTRGQMAGLNEDTGRGEGKVLVKELFTKPCASYPKGRHIVVVGDVLATYEEELPYGLADHTNPYPFVEFADTASAGRFWPPTVISQLIGIQREYNKVRSRVSENLNLMMFPKVLAAKQHQIAEGAWVDEGGEIVEYVAQAGIPPPMPWAPPNVAPDAWRTLAQLQEEFDAVSQIYPASEGKVGGAESGFQTNLLQEAADSVHAPDIRAHEMAIEDAAYKMRRLAKMGYDIPRLITVSGKNLEPDVFEFSSDHIDEYADIIIQAGSALPQLKGARIQSVLELWDRGLFGDPANPENQRKALGLLELGGLEEAMEDSQKDDNLGRLENSQFAKGEDVEVPEFYQDHDAHYRIHANLLKSTEVKGWDPNLRLGLLIHLIQHMRFINHGAAWQIAMEYGLIKEGEEPIIPPPPMMPPGPPGGPPPPNQAPPPQAPQRPPPMQNPGPMNLR